MSCLGLEGRRVVLTCLMMTGCIQKEAAGVQGAREA